VRHLVAEFPHTQPCASLPGRRLDDAIFRIAKVIEAALANQVESKRKASNPVGEDAVVNVAAGGVIAGEGRGFLPGLSTTTCVLVVTIREGLVTGDPKTLDQKKGKKHRRYALREVEVEAAKAGKRTGHLARHQVVSVYMGKMEGPSLAGDSESHRGMGGFQQSEVGIGSSGTATKVTAPQVSQSLESLKFRLHLYKSP